MMHNTKGIVLRTVKYGETSVIAKIFTEMFGVQSYMVNGVRTNSKKSKAHFFQPACVLDLEVYHSDLKNLQRIKELRWHYLYQDVLSDVLKNSVALFIVELLYKCLKQPEQNSPLYEFTENALMQTDRSGYEVAANIPLYYLVHLPAFFGFSIQKNYSAGNANFEPEEGKFSGEAETTAGSDSATPLILYNILKTSSIPELTTLKMSRHQRTKVFAEMLVFYNYHFPEFGTLNTLNVMQAIF